MLSEAVRDVRYALRGLRRQPAFTATAILTLAIGIGLTTAVFSVVHALLLRPLPFEDPDRLMAVHLLVSDPGMGGGDTQAIVWSYPKFQTFLALQTTYANAGLYRREQWNLTGTGTPERLVGEQAMGSYLATLGARPHLGRLFSPEEDDGAGIAPIAILGHSLWTRLYGRDPLVLGKTIDLGGRPHAIVGVLEPGFRGLTGAADVWVPVSTVDPEFLSQPFSHSWSLVARLRADVDAVAAQDAVGRLGRAIADAHPSTIPGSTWGASAAPLEAGRADAGLRTAVLVLFGAVAFVLLIVCVNVANLLLARASSRRREIAIRLAVGSSRWRLVRQLLVESVVLAVAGAVGGVAVAFGATRLLTGLSPVLTDGVFRNRVSGLTAIGLDAIGVDLVVLGFALACALITSVLFGLVPALGAVRADVQAALKGAGAPGPGAAASRFYGRHLLVAAQIALAVVLLAGAGLLVKSLMQLLQTPTGIRAERVLTVRLGLPTEQYGQGRAVPFIERLLDDVRALPGVREAGINICAPLSNACNGTVIWFRDRPEAPRGTEPSVGVHFVSPGYFEALGIPLVRGRLLERADRVERPKVVLVSAEAARRFWPDEDPIGKPVALGQGGFHDSAEVVGVVGDVRYNGLEHAPGPDAYIPFLQSPRTSLTLFVSTTTPPLDLLPAVRSTVWNIDANLPLTDVMTMEERVADASARTRLTGLLLALFAAVALLLSGLGVYGATAYVVEQRTREIGIRMALGADRQTARRMVLARGAGMALGGVALGLAGAFWLLRLLEALLYEVRPGDPYALVASAAALVVTAVVASYVPARRASRVDVLAALRAE